MKQLIVILLIISGRSVLFAQDAKSDLHQVNKLYQQKKYTEAEAAYRKATTKKDQKIESNFNLSDALYKQKKFDSAGRSFSAIASSSTNPLIKAGAYHNLGNSLLTSKKYDESVEAYKKALLNNPKDDQTRYNLAYAQEMVKKQQQQNKNNQNNNKNDQNNQNKNKNKNNQDKNNQDKDKNKKDQNKNDQDKSKQDKKDQQNQQQHPDKVSKDDAQRMLDAMNDQEKSTQDKLKNKKLKGAKVPVIKDW
jgi:Ca-activated chloride channel family protein